ncbi:MFS transporter [Sphingobacterium daejeonense]|uniref:MFS transporter n=1 Tax=Sphingobacterium daejeonense TaxID=371142 RepID=A0ABW3RK42_9SPHI|nr:MFS transporter [Sphingobacterium daejeonense]MCT1530136.1 MFS transporter [Sphingobacterium daejeonense]
MNINKSSIYPWLLVAMLCVVGCLNYLDRMMITTMRTSIIEEIPMSEGQFGLLTSVFLWIYGFASPFAGYLADKFNRSKVIISSLLIWSLVTWLTSLASNFEELLLARALMGISEACYIPAALALIVDYHPGNTKSTATGLHIGGVYVGQSLGFIGGWLAETHSWHYAFHMFGLIGVIYAFILIFLLKDKNETKTKSLDNVNFLENNVKFYDALKILFQNKAFKIVLLIWGLSGAVSWMINGWLPTYYQEKFNLSQTDAGIYSTVYFFSAMLIGVIFGGACADLWSKRNKNARILLPAIGFLIAVPGVFIASISGLIWVTLIGFVIYAFTRPFLDANMMPILEIMIDKRYLATGYGILNLCSCIIGGIGIYLAGILRDANINLSLIFQLATLTMIICAIALFSLKPKSTKN